MDYKMNTRLVGILLVKEAEINSKIHNTVNDILRFGYNSDRGIKAIADLIESLKYSVDDLDERIQLLLVNEQNKEE